MPTWVRVLLTVAAGAWMIGWIIVIGRLAVKFTAELMGEDEGKEKADRGTCNTSIGRRKTSYIKYIQARTVCQGGRYHDIN